MYNLLLDLDKLLKLGDIQVNYK